MNENNDKSNFDEEGKRNYGYPTNEKEWWELVDLHWVFLMEIVFHTINPFAVAYEVPGKDDSKPTGRNISDELIFLKETRDNKLGKYFSAAWSMSSDAYAWSVPFWGCFCDLCSEYPQCFYSEPCDGPPENIISVSL